jgi:hypothetical protein
MANQKIDLKKEEKHLYNPSKKQFTVVDVPAQRFLMIDGQGDPGHRSFGQAIEALYAVSYGLKFMSKAGPGIDYVVMPLEGLWWAEDMAAFDPDKTDRERWLWTAMIRQPDHISGDMVAAAIEQTRAKKKGLDRLEDLRLESYHEGLAAQIMHIGPFSAEGPTIARMHQEFMPQQGYLSNGKHHEIYLSDFRRTAPEKLRTVLRQPVRKGV